MMTHYFRFFTGFHVYWFGGSENSVQNCTYTIREVTGFLPLRAQRWHAAVTAVTPLFMQTLVPLHLGHNYNPLALKRVTYRLGRWPPITAWPLNSWARRLGYSHLGGSVLTQRLLVQLIAICIALLVSQHCLRDISVFSPFFSPSLWVSSSVLFLTFRARGGIRQCLVCD